jgi:hypothetical protein
VVEVVLTVSKAVTGYPVRVAGLTTKQVGTLVPVAGVTAHDRVTLPVSPLSGVTEMVLVPLDPATRLILPLLASASAGATPFDMFAIACDGAYTELPSYCTTIWFVPVSR